jgi:hypothetical protein
MTYDSAADTLAHIVRVSELLLELSSEVARRGPAHDRSKLSDQEKNVFDEYTPRLKESTYGSDEYKGFLQEMQVALQHHYNNNRHHPEFHDNGVSGMTLVDLMEMLADWKAATERHDDGDLERSLEIQQERFGMSDQLTQILRNTAEYYGWI